MAGMYITEAIKNKPKGLLSMGYSYDIKEALSHLQKLSEYGDASGNASENNSGGILGLGSTSSSSVNITRFVGKFSENKKEALWRVELSYTQVLPLKKNESNSHFLAFIDGESQHKIFTSFSQQVIPGKLDEENFQAATSALGEKGFKVGCLLDMNSTGVEYFQNFFPMVSNRKWNSADIMALVNAGCLYVEFISGEAGHAIPIPIIANNGPSKNGQLKLVTSLAAHSALKDLKLPLILTSNITDSNPIDFQATSDFSFPCADKNYDYIKGEIVDYNAKSFGEWKNSSGSVTDLYYVSQPPKTILSNNTVKSGDYYVRIFIPESKKNDAEYALLGKDITIPLDLYKTNSQINYTPGKIISQEGGTAKDRAGTYTARAKQLAGDIYRLCNGTFNKDGFFYTNTRTRFGPIKNNPYDKNTQARKHELVNLLDYGNLGDTIVSNKWVKDNIILSYDCSAFAQMMAYNCAGLKTETTVIPGLSGTDALVANGASIMNQYLNPAYEAVLLDYNINDLRPGDILVRKGHAGFFVGENAYPGAGKLATIESHGQAKQYSLKGTAGKNYTKTIRIQLKSSSESQSTSSDDSSSNS